jgi:hypothetical protein
VNTKNIALITYLILCFVLIVSGCGGGGGRNVNNPKPLVEIIDFATPNISSPDTVYYIDYRNGTIFLGDLPIGARVVDPSWEWEYRLEVNYSDFDRDGKPTPQGEIKPVTWIVVAKNHYSGLDPHVTLLSEELIGRFTFDNSKNRGSHAGSNHWGDSGTTNATRGLRPWLNSAGIHSGEGFYRAFSDSFKTVVLATALPNKEWKNGTAYSVLDYVFIPSTTELGDEEHEYTYPVGSVFPYFAKAGNAKRIARLGGTDLWYWTRSPDLGVGRYVRNVGNHGVFFYNYADGILVGVRPALNLKSETLVSEINH